MAVAAASNAIVTKAQAQIVVGNAGAASEDLIQTGINILSSKFDEYAGYQLISQDYADQVLDGTGFSLLLFPALNVTACTIVEYRSGKDDWTELSTDYWELDTITKLGVVRYPSTSVFGKGVRNWRASFTAGWAQASMPGGIVDALYAELLNYVDNRMGVQSRNTGGQSNSGESFVDLLPSTIKALSPYKLWSV